VRLVQFIARSGERAVAAVAEDGKSLKVIDGAARLRDLALEAHRARTTLGNLCAGRLSGTSEDYDTVAVEGRLLAPLDHPDPAHFYVTGTGLSHLGGAQARNSMHQKLSAGEDDLTDSMKMFKWGVEGGKPKRGEIGAQPEWFYKGDGDCVVPPSAALRSPGFALDGGEEAEIVGCYVIADDGTVLRVGFAIGNEFADHVTERQNYLYLAHSKLRQCSFGPELRLGTLPEDIRGTVRVLRDGQEIWKDAVISGEANMSHSIANLEHHHFKYAAFRRPGDVHCHFFGTAVLSFTAGIKMQNGDVMEISVPEFGRPLSNPIAIGNEAGLVPVSQL
jgi:hypothetical protein